MKTVKFIENFLEVEQKDGTKKVKVFHRDFKPGDEATVTDGHARWLSAHKFIAPLPKEKKEEKTKRETK